MSKLDQLKELAQATPTVVPARDVVESVPIGEPRPAKPKTGAGKQATKPKAKAPQNPVEAEQEELAMPPARNVEPRVQVIFRPTVDLNDRLKRFCDDNQATMQDTISLALEEFLSRRGA